MMRNAFFAFACAALAWIGACSLGPDEGNSVAYKGNGAAYEGNGSYLGDHTVTTAQGTEAPLYLADAHHDNKVKCKDCHGESNGFKLDDNESSENANCVRCHGTLAELSAREAGPIVAHRSHLGEISCTVCHHAHTYSLSYCANCHLFPMQIPYQGNPGFNPPSTDNPEVEDTIDIVVIGTGGAGLTAAIAAYDLGASVILLEKQPLTGGNTMLAAGGMNAAATVYQAAKQIVDTPENMAVDTLVAGNYENDESLVNILATNSAGSVDWLVSLNADLSDVGRMAGSRVARAHRPTGGKAVGAHLVGVLRRAASARALDIRVNSKVTRIVEDEQGNVTGVHVLGRHRGLYAIEAKAVILATGGFSANPERVAYYRPEYVGMATSNQPGATGDGLDIGAQIQSQLIGMSDIQIHPTLAVGTRTLITEALRGNGGILVNREGLRFVNEMATRSVVSGAVLNQTGKSAFVVYDEGVRGTLAQAAGYVRLGLVKEGTTLADLAAILAIPSATLEDTIQEYNQAYYGSPSHIEPQFGREIPRTLETPSFYAIEITPGVHYTMGGLKIDTMTRVISVDGSPIPGFYAAGEVTGGVHGRDRLGGNSISETITFGRIAGANAAALATADN